MTIRIYGVSTYNSQRVTLALLEFGIQDFELVKVDLAAKEHLSPSFLSIQPFHQIPVFESGNFCLYESRAIVRYIAQKFETQGPSLLGWTLEEQALVNQWVEVEAHRFNDEAFAPWSQEYFRAYRFKRPLNEEFVTNLYEKLTNARKHVKAWYDDITSRPAFKKMLEADAGWRFE